MYTTKWETEGGLPDIENVLAVALLFNTTIDELLSTEKQLKSRSDFFYNSIVEYDVDTTKDYDVNIGGAYEVSVIGHDGEKLRIQLSSNTIDALEKLLKVKIDDTKNKIDVTLHRNDALSEAQAKEGLFVQISLPAKYTADVELSGHVNRLRMDMLETEAFSFSGRVNCTLIGNVQGFVDLDCSNDMTVISTALSGGIGINQMSATSTLHLPKGTEYKVKRKGLSNRASYTLDGIEVEPHVYENTQNVIKLSGVNMELVINECTDIFEMLK